MTTSFEPQWLRWARQLQAIAQNGLAYAQNDYDVERFEAVRQVAAEMMADGSGTDLSRVLDLFSGEVGYATPKVDVRGVVFRGDALLLVKELVDDGRWTLPGGWADPNESPGEAVVREVFEESGFQTRAVKLLAVYDRSKHPHVPPYPYHIYKLFLRCELIGGAAADSGETSGAAFFRQDEIPELSISRVTPGQIARLFEHRLHPEWPTDFD
jgi:ADP-ribose pyrophosphatase YjhB (NUDIX family)